MSYLQQIVSAGGLMTLLASGVPCELQEPYCGNPSGFELGTHRQVTILEPIVEDDSSHDCVWELSVDDVLDFQLAAFLENTKDNGCFPEESCNYDVWGLRSEIGVPLDGKENVRPTDQILALELHTSAATGCDARIEMDVTAFSYPIKNGDKLDFVVSARWDEEQSSACAALGLVRKGPEDSSEITDAMDTSDTSAASDTTVSESQSMGNETTTSDEDSQSATKTGKGITGCSRSYFVKLDPPLPEK